MNLCEQIKSRISLRDAAAMVNITLPERDNVKFCNPFRPDRNPSCSIKDDVMRDWSRDESLDCIALYAAAKGITNAEAVRELAERLNLVTRPHSAKASHPAASPEPKPVVVSFDDREPTDDDFAAIIRTRKLPPEAMSGLLLARQVGVLHFATVGGFPCWLVSDARRICAEARRLDGKPFPAVGSLGERKAHTLKGSTKSWPVGLALSVSSKRLKRLRDLPLVLVEGGPDLLAAYALLAVLPMDARDVQPVAMLGTSAILGTDALAAMRRRRVIVIAHGDESGRKAADKWAKQLAGVACTVSVRELPDGCDLNDAVAAHGLDATKGVLLP